MSPEERSYLTTHLSSLRTEIQQTLRVQRKQGDAVAKKNHALLRANSRLRAEAKLKPTIALLIREIRQIREVLDELLDKQKPTHAEEEAVKLDQRLQTYARNKRS